MQLVQIWTNQVVSGRNNHTVIRIDRAMDSKTSLSAWRYIRARRTNFDLPVRRVHEFDCWWAPMTFASFAAVVSQRTDWPASRRPADQSAFAAHEGRKREEEMHRLAQEARQAEEAKLIRIRSETSTPSTKSRARPTPLTAASSTREVWAPDEEEDLLMIEPDKDFFQTEIEPESTQLSSKDGRRRSRGSKVPLPKKPKVGTPSTVEKSSDAGKSPIFTKHKTAFKRRHAGGKAKVPLDRASKVMTGQAQAEADETETPVEEAAAEHEEEDEMSIKELSLELNTESFSEESTHAEGSTTARLSSTETSKRASAPGTPGRPRIKHMYRVSVKEANLSDVMSNSTTSIATEDLEDKIRLLEQIVEQKWFPEPDIALEPNRIAAVLAAELCRLKYYDLPSAVYLLDLLNNDLTHEWPLEKD
ncbi:unnamed protein product [Dibothriocephalus latus]|uniref:Uncharacterized protein n=1 Tax=Dibothriocephalus latus TaxID=60516 RepID=A0A3P6TBS1_DIBLA|nr:unnamed protein product [Dibothriocephalus latus]